LCLHFVLHFLLYPLCMWPVTNQPTPAVTAASESDRHSVAMCQGYVILNTQMRAAPSFSLSFHEGHCGIVHGHPFRPAMHGTVVHLTVNQWRSVKPLVRCRFGRVLVGPSPFATLGLKALQVLNRLVGCLLSLHTLISTALWWATLGSAGRA
jgi:hypothetical protein